MTPKSVHKIKIKVPVVPNGGGFLARRPLLADGGTPKSSSNPDLGRSMTVRGLTHKASAYARAMTPETEALVRSATEWAAVPFVPEVTLLTAAEPFGLWDRTALDAPPFWAFPWAGGQGLARYVLDHPDAVAGCRVLDVASGSGLVAIAAAKAGARSVIAGDIDENALAAIALNAAANAAPQVTAIAVDLGDANLGDAEVVLAADVFYQRELAVIALRFLEAARRAGVAVLAADPGRTFVPRASLTALMTYEIPVLTVLEDTPAKQVTIYRLG
jgi:predicted nicotinamide N-methyase